METERRIEAIHQQTKVNGKNTLIEVNKICRMPFKIAVNNIT